MRWTFVILVLFFSCKNNPSTSSSQSGAAQSEGCVLNTSGTYELCTEKIVFQRNAPMGTSYKLLLNDDIIIEGQIDSGWVRWLDDNAVEIYQIPGFQTDESAENDIIRVYSINDEGFMSKTEYLEKMN